MPPPYSRLAYICEFLLALLAITVVWEQVGGESHLDLMPWYDKFVLIVALALATVTGTIASVSHERAWNRTAVACLVLAILIACAMGAVTYYYHLQEDDEQQEDSGRVALVVIAAGAERSA